MLSRFHLIPARYGKRDRRTDRRTDRIAISISRVTVLTRDKIMLYIESGGHLGGHLEFQKNSRMTQWNEDF